MIKSLKKKLIEQMNKFKNYEAFADMLVIARFISTLSRGE